MPLRPAPARHGHFGDGGRLCGKKIRDEYFMTRFKEIFSGIKSCFLLTTNERLIIMLILAVFLFGLGLRWRHLSREHADRYELPAPEMNALRK